MLTRSLWLLVFAGAANAQLAELSLDPILSFVSCFKEAKPAYCFRERALGYFETWLTGDDDNEVGGLTTNEDDDNEEATAKLSPYWKKMVEAVAERIVGFYGEEEEEAEAAEQQGKELAGFNQTDIQGKSAIDGDNDFTELSRGKHKKKQKKKAVIKAILKLLLIALLIKSKIKMLLTAFVTFLQFKSVFLATVLVLLHAAKLWIDIKHKQHPQKVIYYENAHHQHHYDHHDDHHGYDDHSGGSGWNLWGRSGEVTTASPFSLSSILGRSARDIDLAYSAHIPPPQNSAKQ